MSIGVPNGTLISVAAPSPVEREGSATGMASPQTGCPVGLMEPLWFSVPAPKSQPTADPLARRTAEP